eukprot:GHRQ01027869.1.p1 GENE.GHRQ01027869.1~~GHRQ01027869.1.p1  ORF type:complete len:138 (+),score=32.21 GHRQ01027869.1:162-575(+)
MLMAGFLPFSAIYIELYYIFASIWGHKLYTIYSILFIVFIILVIVTAFITVSLTYFQVRASRACSSYGGGTCECMVNGAYRRVRHPSLGSPGAVTEPDPKQVAGSAVLLTRVQAALPSLCWPPLDGTYSRPAIAETW